MAISTQTGTLSSDYQLRHIRLLIGNVTRSFASTTVYKDEQKAICHVSTLREYLMSVVDITILLGDMAEELRALLHRQEEAILETPSEEPKNQ